MTLLFAFALQCLFPLFDSPSSSGMAVVNNDAGQRDYTATVVSTAGMPVVTSQFSLAAGAQQAFMLREMTETVPLPQSGSVIVDSESASCTSYLTTITGDKLSATEGASVPSTTILLPYVEVNTGFMELNHTETTVAVVNPASSAHAGVTAQLLALDGVIRGSISLTVPPRGTHIFRVSDTFSAFLPNNGAGGKTFQGYVRLNSDVGIVAWQRVDTPLAQSLLKGKGSNEIRPTTLAMIPHFAFSGEYGTFLNVLNPTGSPLNLVLSAMDDRGHILGEVNNLNLAPDQAIRSSVGEFFHIPVIAIFPPPLITGYIRIREAQGRPFQIVGNGEIFRVAGGGKTSAMLYSATDTSANSWILPFASSAGGYFTGYAIANPNEMLTVQTDVTVEFVSRSGAVIDRTTISLSPANRLWR
jgi:hypothetical protein